MIFDVIKKAKQLFYDNKNSGLDVNNVQDAIDDLTQAIVEVDAINEASGSPILLTDTIDDSLLDFKAYGRSTQVQYSGKNLLNCSGLTTKTSEGVTFTPIYDDNENLLYVNANGTATETALFHFPVSLENGQYTINGCSNGSSSTYGLAVQIRVSNTSNTWYTSYVGDAQFETTDTKVCTYCFIQVNKGATVNNVKFYPMIRKAEVTDGTYEPYVGGVAVPNPDYPQEIVNVSRSYFDGELFQGIRDSNGTLVANADSGVTNTNLIPCNVGDEIKVTYAENAPSLGINFYDEAKKRVSGGGSVSGKNEITYKATNANARYCGFYVGGSGSGITPANAKKITVAINGKECVLEVKSKGKNLLNINERDKNTTFFDYTEYTNEIVKGSAIPTTNGTFLCSYSAYLEKGKTYTFSHESIKGMTQVYIYYDKLWGNLVSNLYILSTPNYTHNVDSGIYIIGYYSATTSGTEYSVVKPMLRRAEVTDGTYEPYKEEVKYIPLNEPLRSSLDGTVTDEVSLTEVTRRFAEIVFDGSESWALFSTNTFAISGVSAKANGNAVCSHYKYSTDGANNTFYIRPSGTITFVDTTCATLAEWKAKLQANPITIQYELAEPITETIEPVDIVTYDNVTYLTASDNAEMWVEYYSNSSVGQRLAKTDEQMRATQAALDNMANSLVPTTTGTGAVFCKSGNVVVLHLNGVTTRIDNKSRCLLDISTDVFAQFPPVYVSATKPTQYLVVFRDSETNAVSTAVAKIIQDNGRYYVQILPIMSGTLADNADGTVNGTIIYLIDRSI